MAFEQFTETTGSYRPRISIRRNGSIGFNAGAMRRFGLDEYGFLLLFYDGDSKQVGIRPTKDETAEGAHKLNKYGKAAWLSAGRFFAYFGIEITKTRRFDPRWDEKQKMIILQLP